MWVQYWRPGWWVARVGAKADLESQTGSYRRLGPASFVGAAMSYSPYANANDMALTFRLALGHVSRAHYTRFDASSL